jgi:hypothetical protein
MPPRNLSPGKGFHDGRSAPLGPGKQTLTSLIDAEIGPTSAGAPPGKHGLAENKR